LKEFASIMGLLAIFVITLLLLPLVGIAVGAFIGWVAGMVFPGTVGLVGTLITSGVTIPAWQVGAILGFVGAFFKSSARVTTKS
jgi:hypothetical protein